MRGVAGIVNEIMKVAATRNEIVREIRSTDEFELPVETTNQDEPRQWMSLDHPEWKEFLDRLEGPDGCNLHLAVPGDINSMTWTCDRNDDFPITSKILAEMGFSPEEIEQSLSYFEEHGGCCDSEIFLNLGLV